MEQGDKRLQLMRDGKIPTVLWKLGLPTMVGMLVTALYSIIDAFFVGGLGTSQMGAVAIAFPIVQVIVGLGMTFGSGAASYVSRLLGDNKYEDANKVTATALYTSVAVGIVTVGISLLFLDKILIALGATPTILPYAREYAVVYISGAVLSIFNVTMNNIITAEGAAKFTMMAMIIGGVLNVVLDPILIYAMNMGVVGAAASDVIGTALTTIFYFIYISKKKGVLRFSIRNFTFSKKIYGEILKVGIPTLIFQLLAGTSIGLTNKAASVYGDAGVAAMGIVSRVMAIGTYIVFGYMKGFQPVVGFNYGAKQYDRVQEAKRVSLKWSTVFCCLAGIGLLFFAPVIVGAFSPTDTEVVRIGSDALRANAVAFALFGFSSIYMALFLALGRGKEGGILSICRQGIFFIPVIMLLPSFLGLNGVIYAQPIADVLTALLTLVFALKLNKELKGLENLSPASNQETVLK